MSHGNSSLGKRFTWLSEQPRCRATRISCGEGMVEGNRMNEKSLLLDPTAAVQEAHNDLIANGTIAVVSAGRVARARGESPLVMDIGDIRGITQQLDSSELKWKRRRQDARVRVRPARQSVHFVTGAPRLSRITSRRPSRRRAHGSGGRVVVVADSAALYRCRPRRRYRGALDGAQWPGWARVRTDGARRVNNRSHAGR